MNTQYTIFYDSDCAICAREMDLVRKRCPDGRLVTLAVDEHLDALAALNISREAAMTYLHIVDDKGQKFVGMDAVRLMYRESGWRFQAALLSLPVIKQLSDVLYPIFARNRYWFSARLLPKSRCENGRCHLPASKR